MLPLPPMLDELVDGIALAMLGQLYLPRISHTRAILSSTLRVALTAFAIRNSALEWHLGWTLYLEGQGYSISTRSCLGALSKAHWSQRNSLHWFQWALYQCVVLNTVLKLQAVTLNLKVFPGPVCMLGGIVGKCVSCVLSSQSANSQSERWTEP